MRIALVHDWLTSMRGGEKCLEAFSLLLPEADIFTLFHFPGSVSARIERHRIRTSFLNRFPFRHRHYRFYLPFFPLAIRSLNLEGYELVISISHCAAKAVNLPDGTFHLCYCLTPARYFWQMYDEYFGPESGTPLPVRIVMRFFRRPLQRWDIETSRRVDRFIAISQNVARRIENCYGRSAAVVYPPVECSRFHIEKKIEDYYLIVSALVPYKRIDRAIEAFNGLGKPLLIIGRGPEEARLRRMARANIDFVGWVAPERLPSIYARCKAFIMPGEEDFGIAPLEAQSSGRPVIALARGGVLETVIPLDSCRPGQAPTGIFFREASPESLAEAVVQFEKNLGAFDPEAIRRHALAFDQSVFCRKMSEEIERILSAPLRAGVNARESQIAGL